MSTKNILSKLKTKSRKREYGDPADLSKLGRIIYVQGKIYIFEKSGPFSQIK